MDKLKDFAWAAVIILAVGAAYMEWRIEQAVDARFASAGLVDADKVSELEEDIRDAKETHVRDADRMDAKVEKIVDILLSE